MEGLTKVGRSPLPPKPAPKPGIYVFYALLSVSLLKLICSFMVQQFQWRACHL